MNEIHDCRECRKYRTDYDCRENCEGRDMFEPIEKKTMREMVKVLLYDNGEVEIKPEESDRATQYISFSNKKGYGNAYICKKGMEAYYLKRILSKQKKELEKQIKKLEMAETRINKKLSELKGDKP